MFLGLLTFDSNRALVGFDAHCVCILIFVHTTWPLWSQKLVDEKDKKVKELQDNINAFNFTPQSKMGKMLMTKCRILLEENEEIGNQANEGKVWLVHLLEPWCTLFNQIGIPSRWYVYVELIIEYYANLISDATAYAVWGILLTLPALMT